MATYQYRATPIDYSGYAQAAQQFGQALGTVGQAVDVWQEMKDNEELVNQTFSGTKAMLVNDLQNAKVSPEEAQRIAEQTFSVKPIKAEIKNPQLLQQRLSGLYKNALDRAGSVQQERDRQTYLQSQEATGLGPGQQGPSLLSAGPSVFQPQDPATNDLGLQQQPAPQMSSDDMLNRLKLSHVKRVEAGLETPKESIAANDQIEMKKLELAIKQEDVKREEVRHRIEQLRTAKLNSVGQHPLKDSSGGTPGVSDSNVDQLSISQENIPPQPTKHISVNVGGGGAGSKVEQKYLDQLIDAIAITKDRRSEKGAREKAKYTIDLISKAYGNQIKTENPTLWRDVEDILSQLGGSTTGQPYPLPPNLNVYQPQPAWSAVPGGSQAPAKRPLSSYKVGR
jgi:hypothetical protein